MQDITLLSQIILYVLLALIGLFILLIGFWQYKVLQGETMSNPDGSTDGWHEQKTHYGIAVSDLFLACPAGLIAIGLVFLSPRWGFYLLALVSFWFLWANIMTTSPSLRFEKPKLNLNWWIVFPTGSIVGFLSNLWTVVHFEAI